MRPAGFEPPIPASELRQIHTLDRAATGMGTPVALPWRNHLIWLIVTVKSVLKFELAFVWAENGICWSTLVM
jgi:hypothetical protein